MMYGLILIVFGWILVLFDDMNELVNECKRYLWEFDGIIDGCEVVVLVNEVDE